MKVSESKKVTQITAKTKSKQDVTATFDWWNAKNDKELCDQILATANYLKESQNYRYRQAAIYARLYGNQSLFSFVGQNMSKSDQTAGLPADRPTYNLVSSVVDTLVAKIGQSRPSPVFLTDNSDYKERNLAKKLNNFILGEFYYSGAYDKANTALRDALVEGTGCIKVFEKDGKVNMERVLLTELLTDPNESIYGEPRQLYQVKLVDRKVLMAMCPKFKSTIATAEQAYVDNSSESSKTVSDLVMVIEGWHLPSGKGSKDGRHTIACTSGIIFDEDYTKDKFPFVFLHYAKRLYGFWAQGVAERLMGSQIEINSLLYTISKSIKLVGVPRVFVEEGSKVMNSSFNNDVGTIIKYRGIKPIYEVAPCVPQEIYAQLERIIQRGYQQEGVSALDASAQKPAGLNSGEAIRSFNDISTDRMALLSRNYDTLFIDLAYQVIDLAREIAERDGEYSTVYPGKTGVQKIDLPEADLIKNPYIIQCFNMSSLPRDPAGRMQKVTEMLQAGMISLKEGRRLLDYPDLSQMETLANASEERIFQILDEIVDKGEYTPPDPFLDLQLANELTVQYYNLYAAAKLEEEKCEMLRQFHTQIQALIQASQPPAPMPADAQPQLATAEPLPTSPLIPQG
jgi:hypothetical protein